MFLKRISILQNKEPDSDSVCSINKLWGVDFSQMSRLVYMNILGDF